MKIEFNKEQFIAIGKGAGKIGKAIIIEGTKAVALNSAKAVITQSFNKDSGGIKELELDDMLRGGKKKPKKALFKFKKDKDEDKETLETEVEIEMVEAEIVEPETKKTK